MTLDVPKHLPVCADELMAFKAFLQGQVNRELVGSLRYGKIQRRQRYLSRLTKELQVYKKTGNMEQLVNIAVYCFLESYAPENPKFHWDPTVDSATRGEFGS